MSISVSKQSLQIAKRNLTNFDENSVISFLIEILRHLNALSTPFYTPNVLHVDFSVETVPANRKTQSFKFLRNICHFVPYWDTTAFKRSLHSILHAERIACRFECRNNPCKSQMQYFKLRRKRCYFVLDLDTTAFKRSFHSILRADRIACRFQCWNSPCKSQNAIFQISTKYLSFRSVLRYYGI
jgi:hypothetical protein